MSSVFSTVMNMLHPTLEQLQAGLASIREAPRDRGTLEMIVRRPTVGVREVLEEGQLDLVEGLVGDSWIRRGSSRSADKTRPHPDMQLNVMNTRVLALVAGDRSRWPLAGDQLLVDFDLSGDNLPAGTRLAIGDAVIEVTSMPHTGCGKFIQRFGVDAAKFVNATVGRQLNLRGINARVVQAGGLRVGNAVIKMAVAAWLLLAPASVAAQQTVVVTGVNVIDTVRGGVLPNRTVTISGDTIRSVSASPDLNAPADARIVDGRGRFLIPGLWDMHAHHQLTGEASLPLFVATGVTGTRDMGSDLDFILPLRQRVASGALDGPEIVTSGPILDNRPPEWPLRITVTNAVEARRVVQMLKARGVDFIKVHTATPVEAYGAIAEEARRLGLAVAGHLPRGVSIEGAAAAGQRSIEHLDGGRLYTQCSGGTGYSAERCSSFFTSLARTGIWQTPTLVNWRQLFTLDTPAGNAERDHLAFLGQGMREFLAINRQMSNITAEGVQAMVGMADTSARATSDMQKAGVGILAGCDGMVAGYCLHEELALMVRGGMTPIAALQTATINPARYFGRENRLGSIEAGKQADLVLLDANPLDTIENIGRISTVIRGERVLVRSDLDAMLADVRRRMAAGPPRQ